MALLDIPLERIDQSILQELLIDPKTAEGLTIEYKRICPDTSDNAKAQFLADIVSFANSRGGDLLIGVAGRDLAAPSAGERPKQKPLGHGRVGHVAEAEAIGQGDAERWRSRP